MHTYPEKGILLFFFVWSNGICIVLYGKCRQCGSGQGSDRPCPSLTSWVQASCFYCSKGSLGQMTPMTLLGSHPVMDLPCKAVVWQCRWTSVIPQGQSPTTHLIPQDHSWPAKHFSEAIDPPASAQSKAVPTAACWQTCLIGLLESRDLGSLIYQISFKAINHHSSQWCFLEELPTGWVHGKCKSVAWGLPTTMNVLREGSRFWGGTSLTPILGFHPLLKGLGLSLLLSVTCS